MKSVHAYGVCVSPDIVTLTPSECQELEDIASKGIHAATKMANALILLNCDTSHEAERRRSSEDIRSVFAD